MQTQKMAKPFNFGLEYIKEHFGSNVPLATQQITHNLYRSNSERLVDMFIKLLELKGDESILDVGCGNGFILNEVVGRLRVGGSAVGLDISPDMLGLAEKRLSNAVVPVSLIEGRAEDLSQYPASTFDRVFANFIFHYVVEPDVVCRELSRVLRSDGALAVSIEARYSMSSMYRIHFDAMRAAGISDEFIQRLPTGRRGTMVQDNAEEILNKHFSEVSEHEYVDTLVFHQPEPFMNFYTAGHRYLGIQAMGAGFVSEKQLDYVRHEVQQRVEDEISASGSFRLDKKNSVFICRGAKSLGI